MRILRYGDFDDPAKLQSEVTDVQQRLVELGYALAPLELEARAVGDTTSDALKDFQRSQGLDDDGIVGKDTYYALEHPRRKAGLYHADGWSYDPAQVPAQTKRVVEAAIADLGRREDPDGSNNGPQLAKFRTGGEPWCCSACYTWALNFDGGCPFPYTQSTWAFFQWASKNDRLLLPDMEILPGDVLYFYRPPPPGKKTPRGHMDLAIRNLGSDRIAAIGGNCGNMVYGNVRRRRDLHAAVRLWGPSIR